MGDDQAVAGMTGGRMVIVEMTRLEAAHLGDLVTQFVELLSASAGSDPGGAAPGDPALARLVPDAYADDPESSAEFRMLTERDLLDRRASDAQALLASLGSSRKPGDTPELPEDDAAAVVQVALDDDAVRAWMRTLTALRLVLATRLGITSEDDHDESDPRYGIYDWLGYRLDGIVQAVEPS